MSNVWRRYNRNLTPLPQYLERVRPSRRYYGTIEKKDNHWIIKAEPQVMDLVRRIFQATMDDPRGEAIIPCNKRINGDINWLMIRYPLRIKSHREWAREIQTTKEYVTKRQIINSKKVIERTPVNFKGTLLPFQEEGLAFLDHNGKCLLADQMGLGKTVEALAFICKDNSYPVLIVVPPHLLDQWNSEIKRFLGEGMETHIIQGLTPYTLPDADIYLIHYLLLRAWYKDLSALGFDTIIFDEVQELRHSGTKKHSASVCLARLSKNTIGLSGTPIYNYGIEMYNVMDVLEKGCLGTARYFTKEWCAPYNWRLIEKPDVFGSYLKEEGLLLRRRKEEVLSELPPKRRAIQPVDLDEGLYVSLITKSIQLAREIPLAKDEEKGMLLMTAVNNSRRATGIAKSQHVAKFVDFLLEDKEPCLLFAYHHSVIDLYKKYLEKHRPLCVTGRETKKQKDENVRSFMKGNTDILIVNLRTTSGLNLQRARCVVFGELDWSPAVHTQAEDRVHRIGQKDSVLAYYLTSNTASDLEIMECLGLKESQFKGIMHDKTETEKQREFSQFEAQKFMWNIVKRLQGERDDDL